MEVVIETEKNAASGSTVIDKNRGWENARQNPKKRGTSKDVVAGLDKRVEGVDTSMAELKNQVEGLEGLDSDFTSMREDFRIREEFREEVFTLHQVIEDLQADMALCKRSLASGGDNPNHGPKIDVPKPSPFVGKREARAVDDFLWEMEQYLKGVNVVDDASKIKMATRYLKDTATLWWRRRRFHKLKQSGTIREYVKEFTTLVLEILELSDQDSLIYFLDGLQGWAKTDTRRESSKPKDRKVNQEKDGGEKNAQPKVDATRKPPTIKDKNMKTSYKSDGCFICNGPHRARDCLKKTSLNCLSAHEDEEESDDGCMGSIRILNAIKAKTEVPKVVGKGLQYVEATINGVKVRTLVDSGATHNFVADDE
ncbi:putative retrotransposon gag domain, aspartic peptidase domain protein, partial [Tanacetum coccineum]